jgi:hypothetical protein
MEFFTRLEEYIEKKVEGRVSNLLPMTVPCSDVYRRRTDSVISSAGKIIIERW